MAELVHVAVPDAHQLGDAGNGGFGQIFDAADDAVHQRGQHSCTALENVRQVGDQGGGKFGNESCRRCNEVGQTVGNANDEIFQQHDAAVKNIILMLCQIIEQICQKVRNSRYGVRYL